MNKLIKNFVFVCSVLLILLVLILCLFIHFQPCVKILAYHAVLNQDGNADYPAIEKKLFMRQMDYLASHGYEPIFLSTLIDRYKEGKKIPAKLLVLTFDELHDDFYYTVYPVLKKYKFKATVFMFTRGVGQGYLTWEQLQEIKNSGLVEIGSHSVNHPPLTCIDLAEAKKEITMSKAILEQKLGIPILTFCYPFGAVNAKIEKLVKEAEYAGAVGTVYRWGEFKTNDLYNLNRVYISKLSKYPLMFRFMLSGYYVPARAWLLRLLNIKAPRDARNCSKWKDYRTEQFIP